MSWRWVARASWACSRAGVGGRSRSCRSSPPGAQVVRVPPMGVDGGAQALGEQATQSAADATTKSKAGDAPPAPPTAKGETKTTRSGVKYETLVEGTGPQANVGQTIRPITPGRCRTGRSSTARGQGRAAERRDRDRPGDRGMG